MAGKKKKVQGKNWEKNTEKNQKNKKTKSVKNNCKCNHKIVVFVAEWINMLGTDMNV